jgi:predicted transcriptional regulator
MDHVDYYYLLKDRLYLLKDRLLDFFLNVELLQRLFLIHLGGVDIKRRSRNDIAADILRVSMNGAKKTHIVYEVNLNFNMVQKYLEMLSEKELIRQENGLFTTTNKGKVFQEIAKGLEL